MTVRRFPTASALALLAHTAIALGILGRVPPTPPPAVASSIEIPLDLEPVPSDPTTAPTEVSSTPVGAAVAARAIAKAASLAAASTETAVVEAIPNAPPVGEPAASSFAFDPLRRAPVELRLGAGTWPVGSGARAASEVTTPERAPDPKAAERSLREALAERDVALGLGHAGPLVTAAHDAMAASDAPDVGTFVLEVECDGAGHVIAARSETDAGAPVARALVRSMAGKALRIPSNAHGLRARLRLSAVRTLPAGEQKKTTAGAVPDDLPSAGGFNPRVCDGAGPTRRCVAGMPVGATGTAGDLSNLGAKPSRIVHVSLLGETLL